MASIGESAKRRKTDNMDVDMDIFNGLFCAEGNYKQWSLAMPSNKEDRRRTSDNDTVREEGA